MRAVVAVVAVVVVAGCGGGSKSGPPDPQQLATMTPEQRCEAVAPRAVQCMDELFLAQARQVSKDLADNLAKDPALTQQSSLAEAREMHRVACELDDNYTTTVVACWSNEDCRGFADCVAAMQPPVKPAPKPTTKPAP